MYVTEAESSLEKRESNGGGSSVTHDGEEVLLGRTNSKLGLPQVYTAIQVFWTGFNLIAIVPSIASILVFSLPGGGTHGMIWAWLVCGIFMTVVSLAVAEIGSAAPATAGGAYQSTLLHPSLKHKRVLAWIVGYSNALGNIAYFASVSWACALQIMACAMIGSGFMFEPTVAQTFGVYCGLLIFQGIIACSMSSIIAARLQTPTFLLNVLLWIALVVALPVVTSPNLNTRKFAVGTFTNVNKAWSDNVFAFLLTFLSPIWVLGKATSTIHISDEYAEKKSTIPISIVVSTLLNAVMGWVLMIVFAFCMGDDLRAVLFSRSGEPAATILLNSFGKSGMLAAWSLIIVLQFNMGLNTLTTASRQVCAFAKDGAFKFGLNNHLSPVNKCTHTPIGAIWFPIALSAAAGLLVFAGSNAICRTLFSLAVVGQFVAYTITIWVSRSGTGLNGGKSVRSFNLRFLSLPVAIAATIFMVVMSVILLFPDTEHPTGGTMNYAVAILVGAIMLSILD